jgi:hypothetical protein
MVTHNKTAKSFVPIEIATMGQKDEFLAKIFIIQKWIFIVAFDKISLVLNMSYTLAFSN